MKRYTDTGRPGRVGGVVRQELAELLRTHVKDPRVGFVSITRVEVSPDLRCARILVSVMGDDKAKQDTLEGLDSAKTFLRSLLGQRLHLRYVPELLFKLDESIAYSAHIHSVLEQLKMNPT
jgi:ribosome-binding factor A